jgi:heme-degrading monooxygenase HmoA
MFLAMNRFSLLPGKEVEFEAVWAGRDSYLAGVPGFISFHLMKGASDENGTLYATHTVWQSRQAFEDWTRSEAFRAAPAGTFRFGAGTHALAGLPPGGAIHSCTAGGPWLNAASLPL